MIRRLRGRTGRWKHRPGSDRCGSVWGREADGSIYPGQAQLLLRIRDGEPMSCSKWGRLRYLLLGERLEVASRCQAWATTQLKPPSVIRAERELGQGLIWADQGLAGSRCRPALPCLGAVQEPQ